MSLKIPDYAIHNEEMISGFFGPYRFLSNFWSAPMTLFGINYPTVEHAFQAFKTTDAGQKRIIAGALTPGQAKKEGGVIKLRPDWEDIKFEVMDFLVKIKFIKYPDLARQLRDTGSRPLFEANDWGDRIWGVAYKKVENTWMNRGGANNLGLILQRVRSIIS